MTAFSQARSVELQGYEILLPYAESQGMILTPIDSGQLPMQKLNGDFIVHDSRNDSRRTAEVKIEYTHTGNLFLETWSNLSRFKYGWLHTSQADVLWYLFLEGRRLYSCPLSALRAWCFQSRRIYDYRERKQRSYDQLNDTWGRCAPVSVLGHEIDEFRGPITIP